MASNVEKRFEQTRKRLERLDKRLADITAGMSELLGGFEHGGYTTEARQRVAHCREMLNYISEDLLKLEHRHAGCGADVSRWFATADVSGAGRWLRSIAG